MAMSLSCRVSAISAICRLTTQTPSRTNCPVIIILTKPVIAILVPKLVVMAMTLRYSISAMSSSDSLTPKPSPRIKQRVASYHTTKVIAHRMPKSNASQNWSPSTPWQHPSAPVDSYVIHNSLGPPEPHNPNGISIGSAVFAQMTAECPYTLEWDAPFPPENCPFPGSPSKICTALGPPKFSTQTTSQSVQPFLQGSLV